MAESPEKVSAPIPSAVPRTWPETLFKILVILVASACILALAGMGMAREKARRINCAGNLKCTALALIIYAGDDTEFGYFPSGDNFSLLHEQKYLENGKIFSCPSAAVPSTVATVSNYVYLGDGICDSISHAELVPLSADRDGNHKNWINVAFVDGHCRGYSATDWDSLVKAQGWDKRLEEARAESKQKSHGK